MLSILNLHDETKGTIICFIGILLITPDSLFIRELSTLPNFAVIFYKFLLFAALQSTILFSMNPQNFVKSFTELGYLGTLAAVVGGISNFLFTVAFQITAIANVLVISAASPLFSSILLYFVLNVVSPARTVVASIVCLLVIGVIFYSQLGTGFVGVLCALGGSISVAMYFVLISMYFHRYKESPHMLAISIISAAISVFVSLLFHVQFTPLTWQELSLLIINAMIVMPSSFYCLSIGSSLISPAEISLYMLLETAFGPMWVWLAGFEAPPFTAIIGGIILIITLVIHSILALREEAAAFQKVKTAQENDGIDDHHTISMEDGSKTNNSMELMTNPLHQEC